MYCATPFFCWLFFPTVCSAIFNLLSLLLPSLCLSFSSSLPCAVCGSRRTCCMPHAVMSLQQEVARPMTKPETETETETEPCRQAATKTRWDRLDNTAGTHTYTHTHTGHRYALRDRDAEIAISQRGTAGALSQQQQKYLCVSFSFCSLA